MSKQPRDDGNDPIPVLSFKYNTGQQISFSGTTNRSTSFSPNVRVITLYTEDACFIEIGDNTVEANLATSHLIPAGMIYDISLQTKSYDPASLKYIAVIGNSSGTLYASERE